MAKIDNNILCQRCPADDRKQSLYSIAVGRRYMHVCPDHVPVAERWRFERWAVQNAPKEGAA